MGRWKFGYSDAKKKRNSINKDENIIKYPKYLIKSLNRYTTTG